MRKSFLWVVALALSVVVQAFAAVNAGDVTHRVEIKRLKFEPATLDVRPGDKIVWVNLDVVPHTVTALDDSWDSQNMNFEDEWSTIVSASMSGSYFCRYHPAMKGALTLNLEQSSAPTPSILRVATFVSR